MPPCCVLGSKVNLFCTGNWACVAECAGPVVEWPTLKQHQVAALQDLGTDMVGESTMLTARELDSARKTIGE